jgi:hypothetical protein
MELRLFLIGLKQTWTMLEQYFLYHLFQDEMRTTKSYLSTVKWMELRCFYMASINLNDTSRVISF